MVNKKEQSKKQIDIYKSNGTNYQTLLDKKKKKIFGDNILQLFKDHLIHIIFRTIPQSDNTCCPRVVCKPSKTSIWCTHLARRSSDTEHPRESPTRKGGACM